MSLKEQLSLEANNAIEELALITALNVKEQLLEAASKGERSFEIAITHDSNIKVMVSQEFLDLLSMLLDGVVVNFIEKVAFGVLYTKYLEFKW